VVLAKTGKILPRLNKLFQTRGEVKKTYWAVVDKRPPKHTETLTHYLLKTRNETGATPTPKNNPAPNWPA
jgi:23S rRNA pseudouridine1911/1915/1917 synthase